MIRKFFSFILVVTALFSCRPDACEDVNCNNGICQEGDCICETGYEGSNCETEQRLAFVGDYSVTETCDLGNFNYVINVTADSETGNELTIHNIGDFDFDVTASVDGTSFSMENVIVNGATVNGSGELVNGVLSIVYTMETSSGQMLNCTMTCNLIE